MIDARTIRDLVERVETIEKSGGSGDNSDMSLWQQSVETRLNRIDSDLRQIWGAGLAAAILLACMIGGSYLLLDTRLDGVEKNTAVIMTRLEGVDKSLGRVMEKLETITPARK